MHLYMSLSRTLPIFHNFGKLQFFFIEKVSTALSFHDFGKKKLKIYRIQFDEKWSYSSILFMFEQINRNPFLGVYIHTEIGCEDLGFFPTKDMQIPSPFLRSGENFMENSECAESNEKSYCRFLRFLFFELFYFFILYSSRGT